MYDMYLFMAFLIINFYLSMYSFIYLYIYFRIYLYTISFIF